MKHLQRSLLAIVGLLVMGFTFAAHEHVFEFKKQVYVCKANVDYRQYTSCASGVTYMQGISSCPPIGHGNFDCGKDFQVTTANLNCPGGNIFCCAKKPTQNCGTATCKSTQIFCKQ